MYRAVDSFGKEQLALLSGVLAIPTTFSELQDLCALIDQAAKAQGTKTKGITQSKTTQKKRMADQAVIVGAAISVLATKTNNLELKGMVNYAVSTITRLTDAEAVIVCNAMHEQGTKYLAEATQYGLTQAALDFLEATTTSFSDLTGKRRSSQGTKVAATEDLDTLFAQADALLKEVLDKLMLPFKHTNANLHNQYLNARQIIDLGSRRDPGDEGTDGKK